MSDFTVQIPSALNGHTVCLTGVSGYIGSHLLDTLCNADLRPFVIGRPNTTLDCIEGASCASKWNNPEELAEQIAQFKSPVLINLAGHFIGAHKPEDVESLIDGNLTYPLMIFEAFQAAGKRHIVNIGSTWEYGDQGEPNARNLYGFLKAANAASLDWYSSKQQFCAVNLKLNDTFGGSDPRLKLLPLLKRNWKAQNPMQLSYRAQKVNLLHIVDVQEALLAAAARTQDLDPGAVETALVLGNETVMLGELIALLQNGIAPGLNVDFKNVSKNSAQLTGVWEAGPRLKNWQPRIALDAGLKNYFEDAQ